MKLFKYDEMFKFIIIFILFWGTLFVHDIEKTIIYNHLQ